MRKAGIQIREAAIPGSPVDRTDANNHPLKLHANILPDLIHTLEYFRVCIRSF